MLVFLREELRKLAVPTAFFFACLNLLVLTVALLSDDHELSLVSHATATVGALLIGKTFLLADGLPVTERLARKPFLTAALGTTAVYFVIATALHLAERMISAALDSKGFLFRLKEDASGFDLDLFLIVQLWLVLLLFIYSLGRLLVNQVGWPALLSVEQE